MDRNTVIGFLVIGALLVGMLWVNNGSKASFEQEQQRTADSIAALKPKPNPVAVTNDIAKLDSARTASAQQGFQAVNQTEQISILENDVLKVSLSSRGAQLRAVQLKKFNKYDSTPVVLQAGSYNKLSYTVNSAENRTAESGDLYFTAQPVQDNSGTKSISFITGDSAGAKQIVHRYTLRPGEYMLDLDISIKGKNQLFTGEEMNLLWQTEAPQIEKDFKYELTQTHLVYVSDGDYDFEYAGEGDEKKFNQNVSWLGVKQQFFIAALVNKKKFNSATAEWKVPGDSGAYVMRTKAALKAPLGAGSEASVPLQFYFGPSDYHALNQYGNQMQAIVPYGSGVFAFVKYINRYFLLPIFDFLSNRIASMGIVILLITLIIRLITSPILYKSYLSGAKMKVLKPELDELKTKFKDKNGNFDQQAFGMEQMKFYKQAGVSPLGGCLPALLQIPIFMSLYYFFQSNIGLRGESFLWATDLAAYDSIAKLPFHIPFYGDHVSLFTLTAVITSLLISIYSMSNMQDQNNPLMKYMPYIFPVVLLGVFNNLPSALTWYYTVSNIITLALQFIIQKYVINHEKLLADMNENRKKPVKKSKIAERIEAMQESQRKLQEMKSKPGRV